MEPYISFVTHSRNDHYTGVSAADNMNPSLNSLLYQVEKFKLPCEIIIVDWNYSESKPRLKDTLALPSTHPFATIKAIEVPAVHHQRFKNWKSKFVQSAAAGNVGIRRARGKFTVYRGNDVIYSNKLVEFLATHEFELDKFYRCDRIDIDQKVLQEDAIVTRNWHDVADLCSKYILRINDALSCKAQEISKLPFLHTNACGDFTLTAQKNWELIRGFMVGEHSYALYSDSSALYALYGSGIKQEILKDDMVVYKPVHNAMTGALVVEQMPIGAEEMEGDIRSLKSEPKASDIIYALRTRKGYPYIIHKGKEISIFPGNATYERFWRWLANGKLPAQLNPRNWGLGDENLATYTICNFD